MKLEIDHVEPGLAVQYADENVTIATSGATILAANPRTYQWHAHLNLPGGVQVGGPASEYIHRLTRRGIHFVKSIDGDTFLALFNGNIFRFNMRTSKTRQLWRLARGRRILRNGASIVGQDLIIGDYWQNQKRSDVRIHKIDVSSGLASSFLTFPASKVRHVHLVQFDPVTGHVWIGTGDNDPECLLLKVDPSDPRLQTIGGGSQRWRTITLVFTQDSVYWGSDNHTGKNAIYRYDRRTESVRMIGSVIGPVYYAVSRSGRMVFGTTVEKGEGDQDGFGRLYGLSDNLDVSEIHVSRKDLLPPRFFGYGMYEFADGPGVDGTFWVTLRGFRGGLQSLHCRLVD